MYEDDSGEVHNLDSADIKDNSYDNPRVVGVLYRDSDKNAQNVTADVVFVCDGIWSGLRKVLSFHCWLKLFIMAIVEIEDKGEERWYVDLYNPCPCPYPTFLPVPSKNLSDSEPILTSYFVGLVLQHSKPILPFLNFGHVVLADPTPSNNLLKVHLC